MAYFSQEKKAKIAPVVKAICKKYNIKASLAVRNHSTLCLNLRQGEIDFVENFIETDSRVLHGRKMSPDRIAYIRKSKSLDVNPYWFQEHFSGRALEFLKEIFAAMNAGNHDRSDAQTDYFDVGWYVDIKIGRWNQSYALVK